MWISKKKFQELDEQATNYRLLKYSEEVEKSREARRIERDKQQSLKIGDRVLCFDVNDYMCSIRHRGVGTIAEVFVNREEHPDKYSYSVNTNGVIVFQTHSQVTLLNPLANPNSPCSTLER